MAIYQDDKLVKRAYTKVPYNEAQVEELRKCMHPETGPEYFISNYMYIQHPIRGREKLSLYDFQRDLIENYHKYRKSINLIARQCGKCVEKTTLLTVRNKITGEIQQLTFEEFERIIKNETN